MDIFTFLLYLVVIAWAAFMVWTLISKTREDWKDRKARQASARARQATLNPKHGRRPTGRK